MLVPPLGVHERLCTNKGAQLMASTRSSGGGRIRSFLVGLAALVGVGAVALLVLGQFFSLPFSTTTRDHSAPPVLLEDVISNLRVLDAARESAATGSIVRLAPPAGHLASSTS